MVTRGEPVLEPEDDPDGVVTGLRGTTQDVTDQRRASDAVADGPPAAAAPGDGAGRGAPGQGDAAAGGAAREPPDGPRVPAGGALPARRAAVAGRRRLVRRVPAARRHAGGRGRRRRGPRPRRRGDDGPDAQRAAGLRVLRGPAGCRPGPAQRAHRRAVRGRPGDGDLRPGGRRAIARSAGPAPGIPRPWSSRADGPRFLEPPRGDDARRRGRDRATAMPPSRCRPDGVLVLYTDGLVERRDRDLDAGERRTARGGRRPRGPAGGGGLRAPGGAHAPRRRARGRRLPARRASSLADPVRARRRPPGCRPRPGRSRGCRAPSGSSCS